MELVLRVKRSIAAILNPEDPYEIRDRGLTYAQLECEHVALTDLSYFAEQCPEDPISEMIRADQHRLRTSKLLPHYSTGHFTHKCKAIL